LEPTSLLFAADGCSSSTRKKLPRLEGYARCGETVDLVLRGLTWSVAGAILVNLVEVRREMKKYRDWGWK
jgi:hypothetical protein